MKNDIPMNPVNRRRFLRMTSLGAASALLATGGFPDRRAKGANDRISLGVVGCGGRFNSLLNEMEGFVTEDNAEITALCDVWKVNLGKTQEAVAELHGRKPLTYSRYTDLLARNDIDGVFITAPDHVHCPALIAACKAGKDTYCEKPMSRTLDEAREAVDTVRETKRVVQIGTQRRSDPLHMRGAEFVQSGALGTISEVNVGWNDAGPRWERDYSDVKEEDVDWEGYLGTLPKRPFDPRRFRCWHLYRDYTIGVAGLLGAHLTDVVMWFMDDPFPVNAAANGGTFVWKKREHMDTMQSVFTFPKGFLMTYETRLGNSSRRAESLFYGTNGTFDTQTWTFTGEGKVEPARLQGGIYPTSALSAGGSIRTDSTAVKIEAAEEGMNHIRNWLRCMRSRKNPNATVEHGFSHAVVSIMAHQAADTGKRLVYDGEKREIREG